MGPQTNALSDLTSRLGDLVTQWFGSWGLGGKEQSCSHLFWESLPYSVFFLTCAYIVIVVSASSVARQLPNEPPPS